MPGEREVVMRWLPMMCFAVGACNSSLVFDEPAACGIEGATNIGVVGYLERSGAPSGSFSEDPPSEIIYDVFGRYNATTGDVHWTEYYDIGQRISHVDWEGFGLVRPDATVDLDLTRTITFNDESTRSDGLRIQTNGCDRRVVVGGETSAQATFVENGTWREDGYAFDRQRVQDEVVATGSGQREADGSATWNETWRQRKVEQLWTYDIHANGSEVDTFYVRGMNSTAEGTVHIARDGGTKWSFAVDDGERQATWSFRLDAQAHGKGKVEFGGNSCDARVTADGCVVDKACKAAPTAACWVNDAGVDGVVRNAPCCPS